MFTLTFSEAILGAVVGPPTIEVADYRDIDCVGLVWRATLLKHVNKVIVTTTSAREAFEQESWKEMLAACLLIHLISVTPHSRACWNSKTAPSSLPQF